MLLALTWTASHRPRAISQSRRRELDVDQRKSRAVVVVVARSHFLRTAACSSIKLNNITPLHH